MNKLDPLNFHSSGEHKMPQCDPSWLAGQSPSISSSGAVGHQTPFLRSCPSWNEVLSLAASCELGQGTNKESVAAECLQLVLKMMLFKGNLGVFCNTISIENS